VPTIIDQYVLQVQANSSNWLVGPAIEVNEDLGIQVLPNGDGTHYVSLGPPPPVYYPPYAGASVKPTKPVITTIEQFNGFAGLLWAEPGHYSGTPGPENPDTYKIYRGTSSGAETLFDTGTVTRDANGYISNIAWAYGPATPNSFYVDDTVSAGTTYYYYVVGSNSFGTSPPSDECSVAVTTQTPNSQFISQSIPTSMVGGYTYPVSATFKNTGTSAWSNALGTKGRVAHANTPWPLSLDNATYNNGDTATFTGNFTAPLTPGTYALTIQLGFILYELFGDVSTTVNVTVSAPPNVLGFPEGVQYQRTTDSATPVSPVEGFLTGDFASYPPTQFPASNLVPGCLAVFVGADGDTPPALGATTTLIGGRDIVYTHDQLQAAISWKRGRKRIWLIINDAAGQFSDNSGAFSVIITRYASVNIMAEPILSILRPQFGVEPTYGGTVSASRMLNCVENSGFDLTPEQSKESVGVAGFAFDTDERLSTEMSKGSIKANMEYRDFGYFLASIYGYSSSAGVSSSLLSTSSGVSAYKHVFEDQPFTPIAKQSYYFEFIKDAAQRPYNTPKVVYTGFKLATQRDKQHTLSVNALAGVMLDMISNSISASVGANDQQTLTFNGSPTSGGNWDLILDTQTLFNLSQTITTASLQSLIQGLGGIWAGATVSGTPGSSYVITNTSGVFVPLMVPVYTNPTTGANRLVGGTNPTITCAHTTPGGMAIHTSNWVYPGQMGLYYATDYATLTNAPTMMTDEFATDIDIADRFEAVWRQNPTDVGHADVVQKKAADLKDTINLTMAYNAQAAALIGFSKADTKQWFKLKWTGAAIGATGYNLSIEYICCGIPTWKTIKDSQNNIQSMELDINVKHDITSGFRAKWVLVNDVPNYGS